jgi:SSS family solute:Na+ symporter
VLNLVVSVVLTLLLRLFRVPQGADETRPSDFGADETDPKVKQIEATAGPTGPFA